ncbi:Pimeloyl-ACP methyl ester carboxylesterase [Microbulbifer donghaiensis]|uniref:Pimeloyl-ACP methyl ester carboxylesterase n=1 Tax=Microbulbifer donghaiensis TaxID=494016 RepID=A0A1M5FKD2_9GAMM|nr:alpha/beta hydrolase [Microbulbifer donghaiensis]SHF91963.1 Pimeloyl-ACP methyl ester carboxylesterase [Microbulbifer donghaiensis]
MINLQEWRRAGRLFEYQGWPVFTRTGGNPQGEALVLIHGFPTSSWDWNKVWPELARHYSLYAIDMLGFGDSAKPREFSYLIADQAELIETWLMAQGVGEYHILAHDYGDTVAQELMARDLERLNLTRREKPNLRIKSVCLLNGGIFPETHKPVLLQKLLLSPLGPLIARLTSKRKLAANLQKICGPNSPPSAEDIDGFWALIEQNDGLGVMHRLIQYMPQRRQNRARWVRALCNEWMPVKLIDGVVDPISGGHMVARFRQLVPNADITELPGIGHYPQTESPAQVLSAYLAFRAQIEESQPAPLAT